MPGKAVRQRGARALGLLLVLAVLLTAHSAAAALGQRDSLGRMVICTGSGPVTVFTDAEGRPAGPPHICPDCIMHLLDAHGYAPLAARPAGTPHSIGVFVERPADAKALRPARLARAPPV